MKTINKILLSSIPLSIAGIVFAQGPQGGPPPEALQACAGKAVSTQCTMTTPRGQLSGQCIQTPRGQTACMPEGQRRGQRPQGGQGQNQQRRQQGGSQVAGNRQVGQGQGGRPRGRSHTALQGKPFNLVPATVNPITQSRVSINQQSGYRVIQSNGIAQHKTGTFPNSGNPNRISEQNHSYRVALNPTLSKSATAVRVGKFGVAVNGIPFEPGTAETYQGAQDWHYEALSGAVPLGVDANFAHVQPTGNYHYHGLPTGLMQRLGVNQNRHSPIIGWAADGFPIYTLYGYKNAQSAAGGIQRESSSYRLVSQRPGGSLPGGTPDGTFAQDYQYVSGAGSLDECNGKSTVTPDFPNGTYAYFITDTFPVIPRCVKGTPSQDFSRRIALLGGNRF